MYVRGKRKWEWQGEEEIRKDFEEARGEENEGEGRCGYGYGWVRGIYE